MAIKEQWIVYIIECRTSDLYVGVTKDIENRIKKHNNGIACRYTKYRSPVKLIYTEKCENYNDARQKEWQIKKYSRKKKLDLLNKDLSP